MKLYQLYRDVHDNCYYLTHYIVKMRTLHKNPEERSSKTEGTSTHIDSLVVEKSEIFLQLLKSNSFKNHNIQQCQIV